MRFDWKILAHLDTGAPVFRPGVRQTAEDVKWFKTAELTTSELYNLRRDVGETTDLAEREPERLAEMHCLAAIQPLRLAAARHSDDNAIGLDLWGPLQARSTTQDTGE